MITTFDVSLIDFSKEFSIITISAKESAEEFIQYLPYPLWFKNALKIPFDVHRKETNGEILLALNSKRTIIGGIYLELNPKHRSYGKSVPVFGWIHADNEYISQILLSKCEEKGKDFGATSIRGPINSPKSFGGWGCLEKNSNFHPEIYSVPALVECSEISSEVGKWIESAGYDCDAEYINLYNTNLLDVPNFPDVELSNPPISEILSNPTILQQIEQLVQDNFTSYLPDTCPPERTLSLLAEIAEIPHSEDFYYLAWEKATRKLIGYILEIPNLMQFWAGEPITMGNTNSVIIAKQWRGAAFFHFLYNRLTAKLHARGVIHREGTMIWTKNLPAITSFSKIGFQCRSFRVYQKQLY